MAKAQRNAEILSAGLARLPGFEPPQVPEDRTCVYYRYRLRLVPEQLGFSGPPLELRDRVLHALQREGVGGASIWQLLPLPAQPLFRRPFAPWRPGSDDVPLAPWDRDEHPVAARLLDCSIVLGTADEPLFNQPTELMERYVEAFEKVVEGMDTVLTSPYRPVEPWPPRQPPL